MKIAIVALNDPTIYPALYDLAVALAQGGADVRFLSTRCPERSPPVASLECVEIPKLKGFGARMPGWRSNYQGIFGQIRAIQPDRILAQHEYLLPALAYQRLSGRVRVAGYFSDYYKGLWHTEILRRLADRLDIYVDVCDVRLGWRQAAWPRMRAETFIVRQAPYRDSAAFHQRHEGALRVIFTSSRYVLGLDQGRLGRFIDRLCGHGVGLDWYLPGPDDVRTAARSLSAHPLFRVLYPVEKARLAATLRQYDVGLHWAPVVERDYDPDYFDSAASNKIGEYIAAGLVVAHAGNPGLAYLPAAVCAVFDPTRPEAGADQLAAALADRAEVENKREAALRYHMKDMNFEAQAAPLVRRLLQAD